MARYVGYKRPKDTKKALKNLLKYLGYHKWMLLLVAVLVAVSSGANIMGTYLIKPVINDYALPGDMRVLRHVQDGVCYRVDGGLLRADLAGGLRVRYTRDIGNEATPPAGFQMLVAAQIAVQLAPQYVTTRTKQADLEAKLDRIAMQARRAGLWDASPARLDGRQLPGDWADETVR